MARDGEFFTNAVFCHHADTIDGSTDRCCIAIVTNELALLSGSDQPVRKRGRLRIVYVRREKSFKDRHICTMVYGALLVSAMDTN